MLNSKSRSRLQHFIRQKSKLENKHVNLETPKLNKHLVNEGFTKLCLAFQKDIEKGEDGELGALLSEKEYLENEFDLLSKNNKALQIQFRHLLRRFLKIFTILTLVEIHCRELENEKLLKDINKLKTIMASVISM
ncbi:hypothetical protein LguiA_009342 [Lonicera macranthoides]